MLIREDTLTIMSKYWNMIYYQPMAYSVLTMVNDGKSSGRSVLCSHRSRVVLFFGQVHKTNSQASKNIKKTAAKIRAFNEHVIKDSRTEVIVLPLFDGISFIRKK